MQTRMIQLPLATGWRATGAEGLQGSIQPRFRKISECHREDTYWPIAEDVGWSQAQPPLLLSTRELPQPIEDANRIYDVACSKMNQ
mmetsp:Transcript_55300/g.165771  ORF Transcript_55300/g.165771 Transcript_55300/m.165771 type:complete len:86 (-) Transcript_55300:4424-4681(-)